MSAELRRLLEAFGAHFDLDEAPDKALRVWSAVSEQARKELVDRILIETLLVDTLGGSEVGAARVPSQQQGPTPRGRKLNPWFKMLTAAAGLVVAVGMGLYLWPTKSEYPEPRGVGDFALRSPIGGRMGRDTSITAGDNGAELRLGDYCELALEPETVVVLRGEPRKEAIEIKQGTVVSKIIPEKGEFSVLTPRGVLKVVGTEFKTTVAYPTEKGDGVMRRSSRFAVVTVAVMSGLVAYQFGDLTGQLSAGMGKVFGAEKAAKPEGGDKKIEAGGPTYYSKPAEHWKGKGRIVGKVKSGPRFKAEALNASGGVAQTNESEDLQKGRKAYELWLEPGKYTLRVTAKGYQTLMMKDLVVKANKDLRIDLEFEAGESEGEHGKRIEAEKPSYRTRPAEDWKGKGRIVGRIKECPGCKIRALNAKGRVVKSCLKQRGGEGYELQWLKPGKYALKVTAKGYDDLILDGLTVMANRDLFIDLEF